MAAKPNSRTSDSSSANLGFEAKLWLTADKLRNNMDAAEYKHVVLGLIFLKYISDTFEEHRSKLIAGKGDYKGANPEDPDEYKAENVFWVPKEGRWSHLQASAKQPAIRKIVDNAMVAIERDNPRLKGVLPKDYARPGLDKHRLGELIDLIGGIDLVESAPSPPPSPSGRGSEDIHYRGGYDFSGLRELARELRKKMTHAEDLLRELLRDRQLCNAKFRRQHQFGDYLCDFYRHEAKLIVECDGEPHYTAKGKQHDAKRDAFLKAQGLTVLRFENQQVLNSSDAVLRQISFHLPSPAGRGRSAAEGEGKQGCDRRQQTLFIDARRMGALIDRVHRELTDADLQKITRTYHAWKSEIEAGSSSHSSNFTLHYSNTPGFCYSATQDEIAKHGWVLTPGRYVGAEEVEDDGEPFDEKMPRLIAELDAQFAESAKLEARIRANLKGLYPKSEK